MVVAAVLTAMVLFADVTPDAAKATAAPAQVSAAAKPDKDPNAVVCHEEAPLGSRLTHKVCRREADIELQRNVQRDQVDRSRSRAGLGLSGN